MAIFLTGCTHFGHDKLISKTRKMFETSEEHDEYIIKEWNKTVTKNDIVYLLGDIGYKDAVKKAIPKLNGYIIMIAGNHDTYSKEFYNSLFDEVYFHPIYLSERVLLSHIPRVTSPGEVNIHVHTHGIKLKSEQHLNVGVDLNDFKPVPYKRVEKLLGKIPKENIKFCEEWYAEIQIPSKKLMSSDYVLKDDMTIDAVKTLEKINKRRESGEPIPDLNK